MTLLNAPPGFNVQEKHHIFWFRRDLRLQDNTALAAALKQSHPVVLLFIFDTDILHLLEDRSDRRVSFIYDTLNKIDLQLRAFGSALLIAHGKPIDVFSSLLKNNLVLDVFANEDYEPYASQRDTAIQQLLHKTGRTLHLYPDHLIFKPGDILKDDGSPYTVYTPFRKKWMSLFHVAKHTPSGSELLLQNLLSFENAGFPELKQIGFEYQHYELPYDSPEISIINNYHQTRNFPAIAGTTRLGPHLRFGTLSIRSLVSIALKKNETWLGELIWREFFAHILYFFPQVVDHAFKPAYDRIEWISDPNDFEHWKNGTTGFPLVDAGMRELLATGYMHNRVRMVTASFLTKHLLVDWRLGEAWFARHLMDFELASNNGNWQWAAGTGCDAAPYFRIFNPIEQQRKFDAGFEYIRKWIPEFGTKTYPLPIVDHAQSRMRCLQTYKRALNPM